MVTNKGDVVTDILQSHYNEGEQGRLPSYGVSGGPAISPLSSVKLSPTSSTLIWFLIVCGHITTEGIITVIIIIIIMANFVCVLIHHQYNNAHVHGGVNKAHMSFVYVRGLF